MESFSSFLSREWKAVAVFGGFFTAASVAVILSVDPAYFYPRMQTDPVRYLLKAHALMETGTTEASRAINLQPFRYAAAPGVMRIPILLAFKDFDDQLRAIQLTNVIFVLAVALMSAFVLSWTQPQKRHWMTIAFSLAFCALAPWWTANILYPLADAPYAAFSLGALIVSVRIVTSDRPVAEQWRMLLLFAALFVGAFLIRFSAPVILVFTAALAYGRWKGSRLSLRAVLLGIAVPVAVVTLLVFLNRDVIFKRYLIDQMWFIREADDVLLALNPFASAIPSQIVPGFYLIYSRPPVIGAMDMAFGTTRTDAFWVIVGLCISAIVFVGMWRARHRFLPEILYVIAPFPVLAVIAPSAGRYFASYQPFFWILFLSGASYLVAPWARRFGRRQMTIGVLGAGACIVAVTGLRLTRVVGTANPKSAVSVMRAREYVHGVATPFRDLRNFLDTIPRGRALLLGSPTSRGRWTVISGFKYYVPDRRLSAVAQTRDIFLVSECGTMEVCRDFGAWTQVLKDEIRANGNFRIDSIFARATASAHVAVFRVTPAP
ncbi:MAG: hypothetical protein ABIZ36_09625 [Gemmatimonadaceae bacterium]